MGPKSDGEAEVVEHQRAACGGLVWVRESFVSPLSAQHHVSDLFFRSANVTILSSSFQMFWDDSDLIWAFPAQATAL